MNGKVPLYNFAYHPWETWERIAQVVKPEPWGKDYKVLELYLRANFEIAKSQGKVYENHDENVAFWRAGCLVNVTSDPVWLVYHRNTRDRPYWEFKDITTGDAPIPDVEQGVHDIHYDLPEFHTDWLIHFEQWNLNHMLGDERNQKRLEAAFGGVFAGEFRQHFVFRAIYGELQLKRKEQVVIPQWYRGDYQFLMPLCLLSDDRVDLTAALSPEPAMRRYSVRTLLCPAYAYAYARSVIRSRTQFADWMLLSEAELDIDDSAEEDTDE